MKSIVSLTLILFLLLTLSGCKSDRINTKFLHSQEEARTLALKLGKDAGEPAPIVYGAAALVNDGKPEGYWVYVKGKFIGPYPNTEAVDLLHIHIRDKDLKVTKIIGFSNKQERWRIEIKD